MNGRGLGRRHRAGTAARWKLSWIAWAIASSGTGCTGETSHVARVAQDTVPVSPGGDSAAVARSDPRARPPSGRVAAPAVPGLRAVADHVPPPSLLMPVLGVNPEELRNTFGAPRGTRRHEGIDIMAPRGTPVLAAVDGWIWKIQWHDLGGRGVYLLDASGAYILFYAHLDRYAEGLREGRAVRRGEVLGYVGSTGNVQGSPHLHFRVGRIRTAERWWEDEPLNPYPLLRQAVPQ